MQLGGGKDKKFAVLFTECEKDAQHSFGEAASGSTKRHGASGRGDISK